MSNKEMLSERLQHPAKQWIKAIFWCIIYILFIVWVGNFWWLLLLPLIFDAFITKIIPWTWWKNSKNKFFRSVMSWVDAIVFALVAVYFINLFLFQNYQIPSSSLEKTLLVGDFLFVSKASYGPRIPNTPLSLPLVQNTLPLVNTKSYIEKPQWKYRRLAGIDNIKRNDIVVFNFPTGDTVPLKCNNPDYYQLCKKYGRENVWNDNVYDNGRRIEMCNIIWRPVDKRENYVKRCVGLPGDKLRIINNQVYVNEQAQEHFSGIQFCYFVQTDGTDITRNIQKELGISNEDFKNCIVNNQISPESAYSMGFNPNFPIYYLPLTDEAKAKLESYAFAKKIVITQLNDFGDVFPLGNNYGWSRDNYGPINIPKSGQTFELTLKSLPIYERAIRIYENNKLEVKDGKIFINDVETRYYTFKMNYYWMMGDNRHNSADSRYWGFVPEDHIVGRPVFVWLSLDKDKGWFNGKIRWKRLFSNAKH